MENYTKSLVPNKQRAYS